ncbi:hypothetical protein [Paraburkholderia tropica]|uniref:hypothetical protein n=1 Tax=Paraburkholderia tropica TaxID=92647 RepID=UPI0035DCB7CF
MPSIIFDIATSFSFRNDVSDAAGGFNNSPEYAVEAIDKHEAIAMTTSMSGLDVLAGRMRFPWCCSWSLTPSFAALFQHDGCAPRRVLVIETRSPTIYRDR